MQNKLTSIIVGFLIILFLNSCAGFKPGDARKNPPDPRERVKRNIEEGRGFRLMDSINTSGTNFEFATSNELWRASLDTIDFMPLALANYSGGILVTDWYSDGGNNNESIKISIRFLSNEVRADALDIKIFYKQCSSVSQCSVSERGGQIEKELKTKILRQAAIYVKIKEENKEFKEYEGRLETPGD